jgi:Arc/MetJ-type ribon-helix-helix transcriptional regulator
MQLTVPPDLESLINKRLSSGDFADAEDVLRRALQAQDAEEYLTEEERQAISSHIDEGIAQAQRGELTSGDEVRRALGAMKDGWRASRR